VNPGQRRDRVRAGGAARRIAERGLHGDRNRPWVSKARCQERNSCSGSTCYRQPCPRSVPAIPGRRIGRQAGDLSQPCCRLTGITAARGDRIYRPRKGFGINLTPKRARERTDKYETRPCGKGRNQFSNNDCAVSRLGLKRPEPPADYPQTAAHRGLLIAMLRIPGSMSWRHGGTRAISAWPGRRAHGRPQYRRRIAAASLANGQGAPRWGSVERAKSTSRRIPKAVSAADR
jgi:hypothetical protein